MQDDLMLLQSQLVIAQEEKGRFQQECIAHGNDRQMIAAELANVKATSAIEFS